VKLWIESIKKDNFSIIQLFIVMELKKLDLEIEEIQTILEGKENLSEELHTQQKEILSEMKKIGIEKLPYSYSSLSRFVDPKTMNIHYNKHYKGYVEKLNKAIENIKRSDMDLEEIIRSISRFNKIVRNNAGGAFNHALFWKMLSPTKQTIKGEVLERIKKDFGSYNEFKKSFIEKASSNFGSGWCWLIISKSGKLKIVITPNQDNPLMNIIEDGGFPILGLDLWEHAYYLKYQNKRDEYVKNFFSAINWEFVNSLYLSKTEKEIKESKSYKQIISESRESMGCNSTQTKEINKLFSTNPEVKYKFMNTINSILKDVFPEYWKEKGQYETNSMSGIYDFESKGRSVINKLNTNYSAFCILMNDLNVYLKSVNKEKISFSPSDKQQQIKEIERFCNYLELLKNRIFNLETSKTLQEIFEKLKQTNRLGDIREDKTIIQLKKIFNTDNVKKIGGLGSEQDMISGVDAIVIENGVEKTIQIKPFSSIRDFSNNEVVIYGVSNPKKYTTDYIAFNNDDTTIVFKNNSTKIIDGNYVFEKSNQI
jgi:Fe-Mn family superoxide dismutase